jgi:oligopeptide/dipeptide ABC transporter ATP-binding protein
VVRHISDRVAVMYLGRLVELAEKNELFNHPCHPYTRALLKAVPIPVPGSGKERPKQLEDGMEFPKILRGCAFQPRCPEGGSACSDQIPLLREYRAGHWVRCFKYSERK